MQVTRKIAAAAAVATVATLGLATVVSANMLDGTKSNTTLADTVSKASKDKGYGDHGKGKQWYWVEEDGGLLAIDNNNLGPVQACDNFVPVNVLGVQVPVKDVVGIVGIDQEENSATAIKTCELESEQHNEHMNRAAKGAKGDHGDRWYRISEEDGLLSVSNNNLGPFQVCHNDVPVNVLGVQVPISDINGLLGLDQEENGVNSLKTCELESEQHNDN